jgi:hypothetical protein
MLGAPFRVFIALCHAWRRRPRSGADFVGSECR